MRRATWVGVLAGLVVSATPGVASAQGLVEEPDPDAAAPEARVWHGWFAVGGALPLGGPPFPGVWAGAGLSGRSWGVRAEGWLFDPASDDDRQGLAAGSVTYELGRTKRHLVMTLSGGAGVRFPDPAPVLTSGLHTQLGLQKRGPLVLGLDASLHIDLSALPLDVYFVSTLSLGLAF